MDRPRGTTRRRPRLSRSADFQRVYRQGDSVASRHFVLYAFPREAVERGARRRVRRRRGDEVRLGVSVGRRVGGAVERNRVKRLLREAFWALPRALPTSHDYVVVARQGAAELADVGRPRAFTAELASAARAARARRGDAGGADGMSGALANAFAAPVRLYQRFISPALPRRCKYEPTCSAYAVEALATLRRRCAESCWPAGACCAATRSATAGYDPVERPAAVPMTPVFANILQPLIDAADWLLLRAARRRRARLGHVDHRA